MLQRFWNIPGSFGAVWGLDIIEYSNKVYGFVFPCIWHDFTGLADILMLRFHLKSVLVSRLGNIYCYSWTLRAFSTSLIPILFTVELTRPQNHNLSKVCFFILALKFNLKCHQASKSRPYLALQYLSDFTYYFMTKSSFLLCLDIFVNDIRNVCDLQRNREIFVIKKMLEFTEVKKIMHICSIIY